MVSLTTTATCDGCYHQVSTGHSSEAAMLAELTALGWRRDTDALLCPDCAADAACAAVGHTFAPWRACRCHGQFPGHHPQQGEQCSAGERAECGFEFRWCERCVIHEERHSLDVAAELPVVF